VASTDWWEFAERGPPALAVQASRSIGSAPGSASVRGLRRRVWSVSRAALRPAWRSPRGPQHTCRTGTRSGGRRVVLREIGEGPRAPTASVAILARRVDHAHRNGCEGVQESICIWRNAYVRKAARTKTAGSGYSEVAFYIEHIVLLDLRAGFTYSQRFTTATPRKARRSLLFVKTGHEFGMPKSAKSISYYRLIPHEGQLDGDLRNTSATLSGTLGDPNGGSNKAKQSKHSDSGFAFGSAPPGLRERAQHGPDCSPNKCMEGMS